MKTLFIREGFDTQTMTKDFEFLKKPIQKFTLNQCETAFDAIKDIARSYLSNSKELGIGQVILDDISPLSQLFFWAIKSLQKEKVIDEDIIIIVNPSQIVRYDGTSEKFNEANQNRILEMAHVIYKIPFAYKVQKLCEFEVVEEHYENTETLRLSEEIFFNETENTFERKY